MSIFNFILSFSSKGGKMFQLADGLKLVRCYEEDRYNSNLELERKFCYSFLYQDLNIILESHFSVEAYSKYLYLPIINFGYSIELSQWNKKELRYQYIHNHKEYDGLSTKKYVKSKKVRAILKQFVFHSVKKYMRRFQPPIIIRGPLNNYKQTSERYLFIDTMIQREGYHKDIYLYDDIPDINTKKTSDSPNDIFWMYTHDDISRQEVILNFIVQKDTILLEKQALDLLSNKQDLFVFFLQRNLHMGYNRAAELYQHLVKQGKITKEILLNLEE